MQITLMDRVERVKEKLYPLVSCQSNDSSQPINVNRSTDDAIAFTLHTALSHLENKNTYVRMLFVDYSSAFNTIVPATLVEKLQTLD